MKNGWIDVNEKLPDLESGEGNGVLALDTLNQIVICQSFLMVEKEGRGKIIYDDREGYASKYFLMGSKQFMGFESGEALYLMPRRIIAWQPLPKPEI